MLKFYDVDLVILLSFQAKYHQEFEMCVIKVERPTLAYSLTLAVLVIGPVVGTIVFTAYSVGRALKRPEEVFFISPFNTPFPLPLYTRLYTV